MLQIKKAGLPRGKPAFLLQKPLNLLALYLLGGAGRDGRGNAVGLFGAAVSGALGAVAGAQGKDGGTGGEQYELFHNL